MKPDIDKPNKYEPDDTGTAKVRIGGDDDEFGPEVKIEKFGGKAWLKIAHPDAKVKGKAKEKVKDGKVEQEHGKGKAKKVHRFFEVDDPAEA